jgi:hypothetical protein
MDKSGYEQSLAETIDFKNLRALTDVLISTASYIYIIER